MTTQIDESYFDFIDVAIEALETAPRKLFEKLMRLIINKFHNQEIELQRLALEIDKMNNLPMNDLDKFYDNTIETIENIKLLKKRVEQIKDKDSLFEELYTQIDKLYTSLIIYMDRMGQLEIRILQNKQKSA